MAAIELLECIVVGSGCSGATAARALVDSCVSVTMLDVGHRDDRYAEAIPPGDYASIRRNEDDQHRYLIGDETEGVVWGRVAHGEHIAPPRRHVLRDVERLLPVSSAGFRPFESLGYGGLGIAWGLGCWQYSDEELRAVGLEPGAIRSAYRKVSAQIGVSAASDDAAEYTIGTLDNFMPAAEMDENHRRLSRRYASHRHRLRARGFVMGRTPLALLTEDRPDRRRHAYRDMDFYSDADRSAWRPWMTVDDLRRRNAVDYVDGQLVTCFSERDDHVEVRTLDIRDGARHVYRTRRLVLACGALGTARVALRSAGRPATRLPLLCNPYVYIPCLQPDLVGRPVESPKIGFSQLSLFLDEEGRHFDVSMASLYSYQSLMLFRIAKQAPLDLADTRIILRYLMPGLLIMGLHHPDRGSPHRHLGLVPAADSPTGDRLDVDFEFGELELRQQRRRRRKFVAALRLMGAYAIRTIDPGGGSSLHYAGTLPFSDRDMPLTLSRTGRLHGTQRVYVADSSGFRYLPAKGLTFSLMANARLVAQNAVHGA